ncbi:hypothetical protein HDV63DRAFT_4923 [Trichoderma sp. SZMC 28014]
MLVKTKSPRKCAGLSPSLPLPLAQLRGTANIRAKNVVRGRRHLAGCKEFQKSKFLGTRYLILEREGVVFRLHRGGSSTGVSASMLPQPHAPRSHLGMNHRLRVAKKPIFFLISHSMPTNVSTVCTYMLFPSPPWICPYKQVSLCARKRAAKLRITRVQSYCYRQCT